MLSVPEGAQLATARAAAGTCIVEHPGWHIRHGMCMTGRQCALRQYPSEERGHADHSRKHGHGHAGWVEGTQDGSTPLYVAAYNGHQEVVVKLVELGANIHAADEGLRMQLAVPPCHGGYADDELVWQDGYTPLHDAARNGHQEMVVKLVELGANIHTAAKAGLTPLHAAACNGHQEVVVKLVELGANIHAADETGSTPLHDAARNGHQEVVVKLVELGANIHAANKDGRTPLHAAACNGHQEVVVKLLELGANTYARTEEEAESRANQSRRGQKGKAKVKGAKAAGQPSAGPPPARGDGASAPGSAAPASTSGGGLTEALRGVSGAARQETRSTLGTAPAETAETGPAEMAVTADVKVAQREKKRLKEKQRKERQNQAKLGEARDAMRAYLEGEGSSGGSGGLKEAVDQLQRMLRRQASTEEHEGDLEGLLAAGTAKLEEAQKAERAAAKSRTLEAFEEDMMRCAGAGSGDAARSSAEHGGSGPSAGPSVQGGPSAQPSGEDTRGSVREGGEEFRGASASIPTSASVTSPSSAAANAEDSVNVCVVCMERRKDTLFMPCKHMCTCTECAVQLEKRMDGLTCQPMTVKHDPLRQDIIRRREHVRQTEICLSSLNLLLNSATWHLERRSEYTSSSEAMQFGNGRMPLCAYEKKICRSSGMYSAGPPPPLPPPSGRGLGDGDPALVKHRSHPHPGGGIDREPLQLRLQLAKLDPLACVQMHDGANALQVVHHLVREVQKPAPALRERGAWAHLVHGDKPYTTWPEKARRSRALQLGPRHLGGGPRAPSLRILSTLVCTTGMPSSDMLAVHAPSSVESRVPKKKSML
ncbi:hypothetical protein CYMTET_53067 [Cymbomonas tetramitiformis]|uniref:Uncharacterized protein n=1 Tax=Cymbomonas tetramitiformis TaxID=36881 RepID=A0AAE0EQQ5_9CHLO|nr:hypothetical protein CYMTET_53067 [Cymbomonas tetramitiformis]